MKNELLDKDIIEHGGYSSTPSFWMFHIQT